MQRQSFLPITTLQALPNPARLINKSPISLNSASLVRYTRTGSFYYWRRRSLLICRARVAVEFPIQKTGGFSNNSNQSYWRSLLLPVLCIAMVFIFIFKDMCLIKLVCELRNRVLNRNTIYFVRIFTFFMVYLL